MRTRTAFLLVGVLTFAGMGCAVDDEAAPFQSTLVTAPAAGFGIGFAPSTVVLTPVYYVGASVCTSYSAAFELIVQNPGPSDLLLDDAMFRMIDGTSLGGPMVTIPSSELTRRFGHPLIRRGTRRGFRFDERFGCGLGVPRSLQVDARLQAVGGGGGSVTTVIIPVR